MKQKTSAPSLQWLSLGQAAETLGVHPTTLRRWADQGDIRCMRTPGGHRRFRERDLRQFLDAQTEASPGPEPDQLPRRIVRRTRRELRSDRAGDMSWHRAFSDEERANRRASGRRLLGLAIQFTSRTTGREAVLKEGRRIARAHGRDAAERGLSLVETTKALLFFREAVITSARPGLSRRGQYDAEDVHIHRSLREFLDEVLFAAMAAYEETLSPSLPSSEGSE